ncbi:ATP-binding cassette sub- A member 3 [Cichlidogyrus casuarinus]|uniref:ATP-binding cassette sub- A member 3 n=1 Tax=Cichlidogyrus casuarinus TaxID=1844966 RepID=A0ABD2Q9E2_9PLAT
MSVLILLFTIICNLIPTKSQVNFAVILQGNRPDLKASVNYAVANLAAPNGFLTGQTIRVAFYERTISSGLIQLQDNGKVPISNTGLPYPDAIIDLQGQFDSSFVCTAQNLAQTLDVGYISVTNTICPSFAVNANAANDFTGNPVLTSVRGASVRPSDEIIYQAGSKLIRYLLKNATSSLIIFSDGTIRSEYSFMEDNLAYFTPDYTVRIPPASDPAGSVEKLAKMIRRLRLFSDASIWITLTNRASALRLVEALLSEMATGSFPYSKAKQWIFYDPSIDGSVCSFFCQNGGSCGLTVSADSFTCMLQSPGNVAQNDIKTMVNALGSSNWVTGNAMQNKQLIFAYEAVLSAGQAIRQLQTSVSWAVSQSNSMNTVCNPVSVPVLTQNSRFYQFAKTISTLPSRPGLLGPLKFNSRSQVDTEQIELYDCNQGSCKSIGASYVSPSGNFIQPTQPIKTVTDPLTVVLVEDPPFVINNNGTFTGYAVDVFQYIAKQLKLEYVYELAEDGAYGIELADGQWNGLIGQITEGASLHLLLSYSHPIKRADIGVGAITINSEREQVVDMSISFYFEGGLSMVISKQNQEKVDPFFFMNVFSTWVWLCTLAALVVSAMLISAFDKFSPYSFQNKKALKPGEPEGIYFTPKESIWFVIGAFTQLGEMFDPRATSSRFLIAGFWIFTAIMMALFNANLSAFLTVSGLNTGFKTFDALIAQTDVQYTLRNNSASQSFFIKMVNIENDLLLKWTELALNNTPQGSPYAVWQYPIKEQYSTAYRRMKNWGLANNIDDILNHLYQGWAVFMDTSLADYYVTNMCNLTKFGDALSNWPYGFAFPTNSPLTKKFNQAILSMQSDQSLELMKGQYWPQTNSCPPEESTDSGFKINQIAGLFIVLAGGIVIGFILLGLEILFKRFCSNLCYDANEQQVTNAKHSIAATTSPRTSLQTAEDQLRLEEYFNTSGLGQRMSIVLHQPRPAVSAKTIQHSREKTGL